MKKITLVAFLIEYFQEWFACLLISGSLFFFAFKAGQIEGAVSLLQRYDFSYQLVLYGLLLTAVHLLLSWLSPIYSELKFIGRLICLFLPILNKVGSLPVGMFRIIGGCNIMIALYSIERTNDVGGLAYVIFFTVTSLIWPVGSVLFSNIYQYALSRQPKQFN
jgi:hypothetical protein